MQEKLLFSDVKYWCLLGMAGLLMAACQHKEVEPEQSLHVFCNAEKVDTRSGTIKTDNKKYVSLNAHAQTNLAAFSGKHAMLSHQDQPESFYILFDDVEAGNFFEVEVWRKGSFNGVVQAKDSLGEKLFLENKHIVEHATNGWKKLSLQFTIPPHWDDQKLIISTFCDDSIHCFFDDLSIVKQAQITYPHFPSNVLNININNADYNDLRALRKEAFSKQKLPADKNKWKDITIDYNRKKIEGQLRFYAPAIPYLNDLKWGYQIRLNNGTIQHATAFYLFNPKLNHSYALHFVTRLLEKEKLIVPESNFIPVTLNGESRGLYFFKELPGKPVLERNTKQNGEVLYFTHALSSEKLNENQTLPLLESASIELLNQEKSKYNFGRNTIDYLRSDSLDVEMVFDLEKTAKYIALMDVLYGGFDFQLLHQHFYFNRTTFLLELLPFEQLEQCFCDSTKECLPAGLLDKQVFEKANASNRFQQALFLNKRFIRFYKQFLYRYANPAYLSRFLSGSQPDFDIIDTAFVYEFGHTPDITILLNNGQALYQALSRYETFLDTIQGHPSKKEIVVDEKYPFDTIYPLHYVPKFIQTAIQKQLIDSLLLQVKNYNAFPVQLIGTGKQRGLAINDFNKIIRVSSLKADSIYTATLKVDRLANFLYVKKSGNDSIFEIQINKEREPVYWNPHEELMRKFAYQSNDSIRLIRGKTIHFRGCTYQISEPLVFPANYTVRFDPGCTIDFTNNAFILSYAPIVMRGVKSKPVELFSSDNSGQGIVVIDANKASYVKDIVIEGLHALNYKNWKFQGALTFYNADADIIYSSFIRIPAAYAIAMTGVKYNFRFCHFEQTKQSAIRIFASKGNMHKTIFNYIEENAAEFIASKSFIEDSEIDHCNGKALYAKNNAEISLQNCTVKNSNVAFITTNSSQLDLKSVIISNANVGFVAFREKPFFNPASIHTHLTSLQNVKRDYMLEEGALFIFNDDTIPALEKNVAPLFYSKEEN